MRPWMVTATLATGIVLACSSPLRSPGERDKDEAKPAINRSDAPTIPVPGEVSADAIAVSAGGVAQDRFGQVSSLPSIAGAMIIRTGQASVQVDSLENSVAQLRLLAGRLGGYLANSSYQAGSAQYRSASIELKVPSERFDELLRGLNPLGKVEFVNVTAQDVGEEYADIDARVVNGKRMEQRLIELLATRTGKLQDVLQVERELARVREEIERYEGRLRFLKAHAAMSGLTIAVHEPLPIQGAYRGSSVIAEAFQRAWRNFVELNATLIASLGVLLPVGLAGIAGIVMIRRWRRARA